jgi:hypothetical protein
MNVTVQINEKDDKVNLVVHSNGAKVTTLRKTELFFRGCQMYLNTDNPKIVESFNRSTLCETELFFRGCQMYLDTDNPKIIESFNRRMKNLLEDMIA